LDGGHEINEGGPSGPPSSFAVAQRSGRLIEGRTSFINPRYGAGADAADGKAVRSIRGEEGFALLEVVVSAIVILIVAGGVFTAMGAATRSTAEERHRSVAHGLAQGDIARMRSLRISDLANLNETNTTTQDGTVFTIVSRGQFVTDATGTASCQDGVASADYIQISSTVSWPSMGSRPPVANTSIVSPPNGSISPDSGGLAISVEDSQNVGIPGIGLNGTGPDTFSGVTDEEGCAVWGNLPEGNYTLNFTGIASGLVDRDGNPPGPQTVSVVGESTNTVVFQYDDPGSIAVNFTTSRYGAGPAPSSADSVVFFNTGMTAAQVFGTAGTPATSITADTVFPFSSDVAVYAGLCEGNNPNPADDDPPPVPEALGSVLLPPGGSASAAVQLPALNLTVRTGSSSGSPGSPVVGATVRVSDLRCPDEPTLGFKRTLGPTNSSGRLDDPGLPYGVYRVCAYNGSRHRNFTVNLLPATTTALNAGTTLDVYYGSFTTLNSSPGGCP
jgi:Tfp pilus assembly protein PilV